MKQGQCTEEQIVRIRQQAERGAQPIGALCRAHGIAENTFYRWRQNFGGLGVAATQRLRELEKENARLKRLLADSRLELDAGTLLTNFRFRDGGYQFKAQGFGALRQAAHHPLFILAFVIVLAHIDILGAIP